MKKNDLLRINDAIFRVLDLNRGRLLLIDCCKQTMPQWGVPSEKFEIIGEEELQLQTGYTPVEFSSMSAEQQRVAHERFTVVAPILPHIGEVSLRGNLIRQMADDKLSPQTVRQWLCRYLAYQDIAALAPAAKVEKELTPDEKNMRWALNKYYYTQRKNPLTVAYTYLLRERYCDADGQLLDEYPSIHQFRYFQRKYQKQQTYYISRDGLTAYQRGHRPLLGDGVREFATAPGTAMLDATICDIYLVDDAGALVGRPVLVAAIDAYSSLCMGYALMWEGGMYSLRGLMNHIVSDKVAWCRQFGLTITPDQWPCHQLPGVLVTDMGKEYVGETFGQISELGVTIVNLPAYRPELKGPVEKFFDLIQSSFKPYLKGCGTIEPDFQERGSHDYRKDARLTLQQFESIMVRCILHYNTQRVVDFPFSAEMLAAGVKPYATALWRYGVSLPDAHLIDVQQERLTMTLLPRCRGRFVRFELIEKRFHGCSLNFTQEIQQTQRQTLRSAEDDSLQAQVDLSRQIEAIANSSNGSESVGIKGIRDIHQAVPCHTQKPSQKEYHHGGEAVQPEPPHRAHTLKIRSTTDILIRSVSNACRALCAAIAVLEAAIERTYAGCCLVRICVLGSAAAERVAY